MNLRSETTAFIEELKAYSNGRLKCPLEIGQLVDIADSRKLSQVFQDAIFHAKFVVKTQEVMKRVGTSGEGYDKLSAEFQTSVEKVSTSIKTIIKEGPEDVKKHFVNDFLRLEHDSFDRFLGLLADLSWVKNWEVDGKTMPWTSLQPTPAQSEIPGARTVSVHDVTNIVKSAWLGFGLTLVFLLIDPPISVMGWVLGIIIMALLLYIALATSHLSTIRKSKDQT